MRKLTYIFVLLMAYILFCAKSCQSTREEDTRYGQMQMNTSIDSVRKMFQSDTLPASALQVTMHQSGQKIGDFADYMAILADSSINISIKVKARDMIRAMFVSEKVSLSFFTNKDKSKKIVTLRHLLSEKPAFGLFPGNLKIDSIQPESPFRKINDTAYSGTIRFRATFSAVKKSGRSVPIAEMRSIDCYRLKTSKSFGKKKLKIWQIYLGDMH